MENGNRALTATEISWFSNFLDVHDDLEARMGLYGFQNDQVTFQSASYMSISSPRESVLLTFEFG